MAPGDRLGPYRLVALLGHGGMGVVFAAVHERMGQQVAVKLLNRTDPGHAARFLQEARALSQLHHPGVVRVLFLGETDDGTPYLVLERVPGRSLRDLLREHPRGLPRTKVLPWLAQVAATMAAVHRHGIVHRDLKPDNILVVQRDGEPDTVKIIDFGIARVPPPALPAQDTLVETGDLGPQLLGTAAYMAPEQCRSGTVGPAADVYALGVVLYETLCGRPPFLAPDRVEILAQHLCSTPDLAALGAGPLQRLVSAMLAKHPAARPTMDTVAAALSADVGRRSILRGLLGATVGLPLLLLPAGVRTLLPRLLSSPKKNPSSAIDAPENGIPPLQMQPPGLILIAQMEQGAVSQAEMLAALPPWYQSLPRERVAVPVTGAADSLDFAAAGAILSAWFHRTLAPLLAQHADAPVVYFGVAPIPLILYLGWLLGSLHRVEVRLRHHREQRFVPWAEGPALARPMPPRWSTERAGEAGEVLVFLSTSHQVNQAAARAAAPHALAEVDLRLDTLGEDVLRSAEEAALVADAWKALLDDICERFPLVRRVHLFASVQAGVALLLGTRVSKTMHPPIQTYQYRAGGTFVPALALGNLDERPPGREGGSMDFQALFTRFHEKIKLKDTDDNRELRERRDQVLDHLRQAMANRHRLRFTMFNSGSYAMGTGVQPLPGADYDIDVGVVFALEHARQDARTLKEWVHRELPSSLGKIEWRRPCITVFRKDHHVDLGIFVQDGGGLWLAVGKPADPGAWQQDGIQLFIKDVRERFPGSPGDHGQFQRTIRYLKRWKDEHFQGQGVKAPVGLALTVMAYHWFSPRRRAEAYDDLAAVTDLVRRVLQEFGPGQTGLPFPRAPRDNLLRKLSAEQVAQMRGRFEKLLALLEQARTSGNAAPLHKAFGRDFPEA